MVSRHCHDRELHPLARGRYAQMVAAMRGFATQQASHDIPARHGPFHDDLYIRERAGKKIICLKEGCGTVQGRAVRAHSMSDAFGRKEFGNLFSLFLIPDLFKPVSEYRLVLTFGGHHLSSLKRVYSMPSAHPGAGWFSPVPAIFR